MLQDCAAHHNSYCTHPSLVPWGAQMGCFRPIQYLGSKLRVLDEICDAACSLIGREGNVVDLFTGSTVVAQSLAGCGHSVTTVDSQSYSQILAKACLSIGRLPYETCTVDEIAHNSLPERIEENFQIWEPYASIEEKMLASEDACGLRKLYERLPLIWRNAESPYHRLVEGKGVSFPHLTIPLITSIYAGSYFGVKQALELDRLRYAIFLLHETRLISDWQKHAALASLLSAASATVHSAGKHFAQPLSGGRMKNSDFKNKRLLQDRNISVKDSFAHSCAMINKLSMGDGSKHSAFCDSAENFLERNERDDFDLYYLDPPYTAQQYSRFYHILETLCTYESPKLITDGQLTTGLYPEKRFRSAFCSKSRALLTIKKIIQKARQSNACLIISYSYSHTGSDGNARMISLMELLEACKQEYGARSVVLWNMGHNYRQFNSKKKTNKKRNDPEILVTCRID